MSGRSIGPDVLGDIRPDSLSQARLDIHCNSLPSDDCSAISNHRTESESRNLEGGDTKTLDLLLL
ncbi:hypothetical protein ACSBR2_026183 [Camellia fascicularis]